MDTTTEIQWRVACQLDGKTHRGRKTFDNKRFAEKASSKLQALANDAGMDGIYYAEPATAQGVEEAA